MHRMGVVTRTLRDECNVTVPVGTVTLYARFASRIVQVIGVSHLSRRLSRSSLAAAESL